ncbi:MAG: DUF1848 family protein [Caldithrix sp.]|nr:DUF1848 family protein [Caldithrix sp.]
MALKTIISASRRTDIPAFYLKWLREAVRQGSVEVRNPFNSKVVFDVDLRPHKVAWMVFWSRNYAHLINHRQDFDAYQLFFHFTIVPHCRLQKSSIPMDTALKQMEELAKWYGGQRIIWRFDPIVQWRRPNGQIESNFSLETFRYLCRRIGVLGVKQIYFSFAYPYAKLNKRVNRWPESVQIVQKSLAEQKSILQSMRDTADANDMQLFSCCNDAFLQISGIRKGHCIDGRFLNRLAPTERVSVAKRPTREHCGCTASVDIGDYQQQPCYFGCFYCYANPKI